MLTIFMMFFHLIRLILLVMSS